jgi:hypothetical protein
MKFWRKFFRLSNEDRRREARDASIDAGRQFPGLTFIVTLWEG